MSSGCRHGTICCVVADGANVLSQLRGLGPCGGSRGGSALCPSPASGAADDPSHASDCRQVTPMPASTVMQPGSSRHFYGHSSLILEFSPFQCNRTLILLTNAMCKDRISEGTRILRFLSGREIGGDVIQPARWLPSLPSLGQKMRSLCFSLSSSSHRKINVSFELEDQRAKSQPGGMGGGHMTSHDAVQGELSQNT